MELLHSFEDDIGHDVQGRPRGRIGIIGDVETVTGVTAGGSRANPTAPRIASGRGASDAATSRSVSPAALDASSSPRSNAQVTAAESSAAGAAWTRGCLPMREDAPTISRRVNVLAAYERRPRDTDSLTAAQEPLGRGQRQPLEAGAGVVMLLCSKAPLKRASDDPGADSPMGRQRA